MLILSRILHHLIPANRPGRQEFACSIFVYCLAIAFSVSPKTATAQVQNAVSIDLKGLINKAFEKNTNLLITIEELKINRLDMEIQGTALKPEVRAYGRYHRYYDDQPVTVFPEGSWTAQPGYSSNDYNRIPTGLPNNLAGGLLIEQRVFDYRFFLGGKSRDAFQSVSQYRLKDAQNELAHEIARQYYQLLEMESKKELIVFNKKRLQKAERILSIQVETDMALQTELEKTKLKLEKTQVLENRLLSGIYTKTAYIKSIAGIAENEILKITASQADTAPSLPAVEPTGINETMNYRLLEQMKASNMLKIESARADHLPSLNFFADINWYSQSSNASVFDSDNMNHQGFLGLRLDIPIYAGGSFRKQQQKAGIENEIVRLRQEQLKTGQQLQYSRLKQELQSLYDEWMIQNKIEAVTLQQLKQADKRFEEGITNINALFEAEDEWQKAGTEKNEILLKIKLAELELLRASGQIEILYK